MECIKKEVPIMSEEEIMRKFNEAINGPKNPEPAEAYKVANNTNLNTANFQTSDPLNINIVPQNQNVNIDPTPLKRDETTNSNNLYNNPNPVNNINNIIPNDTIQNQYINNPIPPQNINNIPSNPAPPTPPEPQMMQRTTITGNPINTPDFTETPVNTDNNISYSNVNYTKKTPKKKATITITPEIKLAMIIVIILLVFVFFFPDIVKFFRKIFLGISR